MGTTKLFFLEITPYVRRAQSYLDANGISYVEHYLAAKSLSRDQLIEILQYTVNGVDEIIAIQSKAYKELKSQGVDFNEYTISELVDLFKQYPTVLKSPIIVGKNTTIAGYKEEEMSVLKTRKRKMEAYRQLLHEFHAQQAAV